MIKITCPNDMNFGLLKSFEENDCCFSEKIHCLSQILEIVFDFSISVSLISIKKSMSAIWKLLKVSYSHCLIVISII
jgi:hypothetical protein